MMSRRSLFGFLATLPFVGAAFAERGDRIVIDDPHADGKLFARKGERVTCPNGHFVCEFTRDVKYGEFFDPTALGNWQQPSPELGTMHYDAGCKVREPGAALPCGAYWFHGMNYHFNDGWR